MIEQDGDDCIVTLPSQGTKRIKNCDALILSNTIFNKGATRYSRQQMIDFGFELKPWVKAIPVHCSECGDVVVPTNCVYQDGAPISYKCQHCGHEGTWLA